MKNLSIHITISSNKKENIREVYESIENYLECAFEDVSYEGFKIVDLDKEETNCNILEENKE